MSGAPGISWAGLVAGPGAWAISTQLNYAIAAPQCLWGAYPVPWMAIALALLALAGAGLSFQSYRQVEARPAKGHRKPRTEVFLSLLSIGLAVLFGVIIFLQAYAGFVFTGCER